MSAFLAPPSFHGGPSAPYSPGWLQGLESVGRLVDSSLGAADEQILAFSLDLPGPYGRVPLHGPYASPKAWVQDYSSRQGLASGRPHIRRRKHLSLSPREVFSMILNSLAPE
jgi:hypothetical protein